MVCLGTFWGKFSLSGDFLDKCLVFVRFFNFRVSWQPPGDIFLVDLLCFVLKILINGFHVSTPPPKNPEKKLKSSSPKMFLFPLVAPDINQHSHMI